MTITPQLINVGSAPNDGTGDRPRPMALKYNTTVTALADALNALPATLFGGTGATTGQVLGWNGTIWLPVTVTGNGQLLSAAAPLAINGNTISLTPDPFLAIAKRATYYPAQFCTLTDGGTFADGAYHAASANGFATLAALKAVFSFATALSDDLCGLALQAAINAAHLTSGTVWLPPGKLYLPNAGISMPSNTPAVVQGIGDTATILLASRCGSNPAIADNGARYADVCPLRNVAIWGKDTKVYDGRTNAGTPNATLYTAGTTGLLLNSVAYSEYVGLTVQNFDVGVNVSAAVGNNYCFTFRKFSVCLNNVGIAFNFQGAPNSGERVVVLDSIISNNNTGVLVTVGDGNTSQVVADILIDLTSFDYNIVRAIDIVGGVRNNVRQNLVRATNCHWETSAACSGASHSFVRNGSTFHASGGMIFFDGGAPISLVAPAEYYSDTQVEGLLRVGSTPFPLVADAAGGSYPNVRGWGDNFGPLFSSAGGIMSAQGRKPDQNYLTFPYTLRIEDLFPGQKLVLGSNSSLTVPPDSSLQALPGTTIRLLVEPSIVAPLIAGSGVTLIPPISSLGGGSTAVEIDLTRARAGNTWYVNPVGSGSAADVVVIDGTKNPATQANPYKLKPNERVVRLKQNPPGPSYILMPDNPLVGFDYKFIDENGDSATNPTTISGPSGVKFIGQNDGGTTSTYTINSNSAGRILCCLDANTYGAV